MPDTPTRSGPLAERHHPTVCTTGRHGCWSYCSCGWQSASHYRSGAGASLAWAEHMREVNDAHA